MSVCLGASCNFSHDLAAGGGGEQGPGSEHSYILRGLTFLVVKAKVINKYQLAVGSDYRQIIFSRGVLTRV